MLLEHSAPNTGTEAAYRARATAASCRVDIIHA